MSTGKSLITDFTEGNATKQLLIFASPLFLSNLLQIVYNMVDMVIVGRVMGPAGLSAVSVGGDVSSFLTFIAMGFANAGQVIIAKYIGRGHSHKIGRFVSTMFGFLLSVALLLSVLCLVWRRQILELMNTPPEAFSEALAYATICMIGMVFIYGYNAVSAVLRGMGDSRHPFLFISLAAIVNILLDILFVMHLRMGAGGAALATVISQGGSFLACMVFWRTRKEQAIRFSLLDLLRWDREMLTDLVKLGIPMAIKGASVHFSKLFVNAWINSYGITISAFAGIASKISSTANLVSNSFNAAGSSMVGQNIGARKYDRVKKIVRSVFGVTFVSATVFSLLFLLFPDTIYGFFTDDPDVIRVGLTYLPIAFLLFYGSCARSGMNALINGCGNYKMNFLTAILDGIVLRIGLAVLFGLVCGYGAYGFWLGDALAGFTPFWLGMIYYLSGRWMQSK